MLYSGSGDGSRSCIPSFSPFSKRVGQVEGQCSALLCVGETRPETDQVQQYYACPCPCEEHVHGWGLWRCVLFLESPVTLPGSPTLSAIRLLPCFFLFCPTPSFAPTLSTGVAFLWVGKSVTLLDGLDRKGLLFWFNCGFLRLNLLSKKKKTFFVSWNVDSLSSIIYSEKNTSFWELKAREPTGWAGNSLVPAAPGQDRAENSRARPLGRPHQSHRERAANTAAPLRADGGGSSCAQLPRAPLCVPGHSQHSHCPVNPQLPTNR